MMRQPHLYLFMHFLFYNHLDVLLVSKIKSTASSVLRHIGKTIILDINPEVRLLGHIVILYANNEVSKKENNKAIPFTIASKSI